MPSIRTMILWYSHAGDKYNVYSTGLLICLHFIPMLPFTWVYHSNLIIQFKLVVNVGTNVIVYSMLDRKIRWTARNYIIAISLSSIVQWVRQCIVSQDMLYYSHVLNVLNIHMKLVYKIFIHRRIDGLKENLVYEIEKKTRKIHLLTFVFKC